ncbi:hypothetical protein cypCar_00011984 [Cyprinus carpio]|nr:hypothetical protein cypCar_00011984 [Cyprinus carpio]
MSQIYKFGSSVKVEQLEEELSAQIEALKTEIEDNEILHQISSKPFRGSIALSIFQKMWLTFVWRGSRCSSKHCK